MIRAAISGGDKAAGDEAASARTVERGEAPANARVPCVGDAMVVGAAVASTGEASTGEASTGKASTGKASTGAHAGDTPQRGRKKHLVFGSVEGVQHGRKQRLLDLHIGVAELVPRLLLSQPHHPDGRVAEHHRRDVCVFDTRPRLATKESVGEATTRSNGDGGEGVAVCGAVAQAKHRRR